MDKPRVELYVAYAAVVLAAVFLRLMPHLPNVTPIAALALFSGATGPGIAVLGLPLVAMVLSDIFIGFHQTIPFVYGGFLLIAGIGYLLRKKITASRIVVGSLSGSILFFLITNFGVWLTSSMYDKSFAGLLYCYQMGLPFFRNTIVGDLLYTGAFFVGFRILTLLFVLMLPVRQNRRTRHVGNTV
jgi:hypothetical protein